MEESSREISETLYELIQLSVEHMQSKLINPEGCSAIMYSLHSGEARASVYQFGSSVEDALEQCAVDLSNELRDAEAYAITYDQIIRRQDDNEEIPVMMTEIEERGMDEAQFVAICYQRVQQGDALPINTLGSLFGLGGCQLKRLSNNTAATPAKSLFARWFRKWD